MLVPAVPELFDDENHPAIDIRTDSLSTYRELGPPDLVRLVKQSTKNATKTAAVYHHVTGIDASSSASLAAYINTVVNTLNTSSEKNFKVTSALYCCYNAFSRLDLRVKVNYPGWVESYCVDEKGDYRVTTDELWLETYLCSVLRSYSYGDGGDGESVKKIVGCRRFNPIMSTEAEHKFLDAAERLFFNGPQLGSSPEVQVPNLVSNHLTTGILKYITTTGRYASGVNLFEKLRIRDPGISALLARVLVAADEEVKAVQVLAEAIRKLPMEHTLLDVQAEFCRSKGRDDMSLHLAKRSVISAPSEFSTWARLAQVYISLERWDLALLTLNSCPMFTYQDKDSPRLPPPERVHLPVMPESACEEIDESQPNADADTVHPSLRRLTAANFKGTFETAYGLLTNITKRIGWDKLLQIRSQVFVMEEEYKTERQAAPKSRNASTVALNGSLHGADDGVDAPGSSDGVNGARSHVSRPSQTITATTVRALDDDPDPEHRDYDSFRHKRLCERWLDNLFMVLYEDLRIYTLWRTEAAHYRQQQLQFKKSADEWEILGDLAHRLHYERESVEAYQQCLGQRFSPKAMKGVLLSWQKEGDLRGVIGATIRLICWQYRWYSEFSPFLLETVRKLIEDEGAVKVRSIINSTNLPQHVLDLTHQYGQLCAAFRSSGTEAGA